MLYTILFLLFINNFRYNINFYNKITLPFFAFSLNIYLFFIFIIFIFLSINYYMIYYYNHFISFSYKIYLLINILLLFLFFKFFFCNNNLILSFISTIFIFISSLNLYKESYLLCKKATNYLDLYVLYSLYNSILLFTIYIINTR